jgi:hypothetical protein
VPVSLYVLALPLFHAIDDEAGVVHPGPPPFLVEAQRTSAFDWQCVRSDHNGQLLRRLHGEGRVVLTRDLNDRRVGPCKQHARA